MHLVVSRPGSGAQGGREFTAAQVRNERIDPWLVDQKRHVKREITERGVLVVPAAVGRPVSSSRACCWFFIDSFTQAFAGGVFFGGRAQDKYNPFNPSCPSFLSCFLRLSSLHVFVLQGGSESDSCLSIPSRRGQEVDGVSTSWTV